MAYTVDNITVIPRGRLEWEIPVITAAGRECAAFRLVGHKHGFVKGYFSGEYDADAWGRVVDVAEKVSATNGMVILKIFVSEGTFRVAGKHGETTVLRADVRSVLSVVGDAPTYFLEERKFKDGDTSSRDVFRHHLYRTCLKHLPMKMFLEAARMIWGDGVSVPDVGERTVRDAVETNDLDAVPVAAKEEILRLYTRMVGFPDCLWKVVRPHTDEA